MQFEEHVLYIDTYGGNGGCMRGLSTPNFFKPCQGKTPSTQFRRGLYQPIMRIPVIKAEMRLFPRLMELIDPGTFVVSKTFLCNWNFLKMEKTWTSTPIHLTVAHVIRLKSNVAPETLGLEDECPFWKGLLPLSPSQMINFFIPIFTQLQTSPGFLLVEILQQFLWTTYTPED